ncbi:hypothetical protein MPSEU_000076300 [Mayamaea pseudoterrestris]|nr:hypothetical protein MPSEU_000076300 [Mayamaea pseudoterrestris]
MAAVASSTAAAAAKDKSQQQVESLSMLSPFDIALVYDKDGQTCGHRLAFEELLDRCRSHASHGAVTCPTCELAIAMVRDEAALDPASQTVTLKHGRLTYELTLPDEGAKPNSHASSWLHMGSSSGASAPKTVQARIAQALGLNAADMKILHKGKVLFPSPTNRSEEEINELLLSHSQPLHGKPQLLVMGTSEKDQLPKHGTSQHAAAGLWSKFMTFSQRVIVATLHVSISIVLSILQKIYDFAMPLLKRNEEQQPASASRRRD